MLQLTTASPHQMAMPEAPGQRAAASFAKMHLNKVDEEIHILSLSFFQRDEDLLRTIHFKMRPVDLDSRNRPREIVDVYPLNGTAKNRKFNITDYVRKNHREELRSILDIADGRFLEQSNPYCLVVDFKDSSVRYNDRSQIAALEQQFVDFFSRQGSDKRGAALEIYDLIRRSKIAMFINEGSLKADLIEHVFSKVEADYLHTTESGSPVLCQLCEILMNSFKRGWEVEVEGLTFAPKDYIRVIDEELMKKMDVHPPTGQQLTRLVTFYPAHYQELYSESSEYYKLVSQAYKVNHHVENNTTILSIE